MNLKITEHRSYCPLCRQDLSNHALTKDGLTHYFCNKANQPPIKGGKPFPPITGFGVPILVSEHVDSPILINFTDLYEMWKDNKTIQQIIRKINEGIS